MAVTPSSALRDLAQTRDDGLDHVRILSVAGPSGSGLIACSDLTSKDHEHNPIILCHRYIKHAPKALAKSLSKNCQIHRNVTQMRHPRYLPWDIDRLKNAFFLIIQKTSECRALTIILDGPAHRPDFVSDNPYLARAVLARAILARERLGELATWISSRWHAGRPERFGRMARRAIGCSGSYSSPSLRERRPTRTSPDCPE